jgi:hypothetical protein
MAEVVGSEERWIRQLRDIRDGIGHVLPAQDKISVEQMIAMLCSAQLFAALVLFRQLGFNSTECRWSLEHHWELDDVREQVKRGFPGWFDEPGTVVAP